MSFKEVDIKSLNFNPFKLIGKDWMLITAGDKEKFNTMTASWGGLGVLWNKNVAFSFIRPQRYTLEFIEKQEYYTLSFYEEKYRSALTLCGRKSGRNTEKITESGLNVEFYNDVPYFKEASMVLVCKKLHGQYIDPSCFIDEKINDCYEQKDYHKMFIGEIVKVLVNE